MHIAQVAPLTEAIPPKLYGGTERVVSWLTEELIALGHDVTLFASGDSVTSARLEPVWPRALAARRRGARPQCAAYDDARARLPVAPRVRHPALSSRLLSVLAVFAPVDAVRDDAARPARSAGASADVRHVFDGARCIDFERAAPAAAAGELGAHRPSRPAGATCLRQSRSSRAISRSSAASRRRRASIALSTSRSIAACRSRVAAKVDRADQDYFDEQIEPLMTAGNVEYHRRDHRQGQAGIPERRDRAAGADRLAGAVRPGDDRGHGLRHAGDRVQSRLGAGDRRRRCHRFHRRRHQWRDRRRRPARPSVARKESAAVSRSVSPHAAWRRIIWASIAACRTRSRRICGWSPTTRRRCRTSSFRGGAAVAVLVAAVLSPASRTTAQ